MKKVLRSIAAVLAVVLVAGTLSACLEHNHSAGGTYNDGASARDANRAAGAASVK